MSDWEKHSTQVTGVTADELMALTLALSDGDVTICAALKLGLPPKLLAAASMVRLLAGAGGEDEDDTLQTIHIPASKVEWIIGLIAEQGFEKAKAQGVSDLGISILRDLPWPGGDDNA